MATSAEDSSIIEEELTCAVCLELYRDPHLLPCGHNFCLQCLQKLKSPSDHGRLRCPECRQSHRIYINYPKNLKLANIADGFRRRAQSERSTQSRSDPSHKPAEVRCDYCPGDGSEDGKGPMAVKTCLKCEVSMCPIHVQPHLELPAFREHPLVEPLNDMRKRKCLEHDEMFQYYCIDEGLFLCNACTIEGKHNGHNIKTLKNTMKDFKVNLDVKLHKTTRKILRAERNLLDQTQFVRHCEASRDDADQNLDAFRETSIVHLDAFLSSLRECVSTYNSERCSGIQHNLSRIAQDQTRLREVHSSFERLLHESDAFQFIKDYNSSMKRYQRWLRKPLFFPDEPTMDIEPLYEIMEGKMEEFIAEMRQHSSTLISTLFEFEGGDGEEVDDDDDEESDDDDDENESDAEGEEEMSEEEEEQHLTESEVEEYIPEEEDDDDDDEED